MNAIQSMGIRLNATHTENGDLAYKSTGSACLDLFSLCGGMRNNTTDLTKLFTKAYFEDHVLAIKILFYLRDIRGGLGERNSFRVLLQQLATHYPETAKQIVAVIPTYGRWDDLLVLLDTPVKDDAIALIKKQIEEDKMALETGKEVSLLGKWLPSINTSSSKSIHNAKIIMSVLGMKAVDYRKLCSALRKSIKIIEDNLRRKDYTFDYSKQPSQAMHRYKKAFIRNDEERYKSFLNKVITQTEKIARGEEIPEEEKVKLNTKTLYPYQIVAPFMRNMYSRIDHLPSNEEMLALEASWRSLDRSKFSSRTIVVRDGSGSMYGIGDFAPINVATSLAMLFSEQLTGAYKNSFITFSSRPELVQIPDTADTLYKKTQFLQTFDDCSNTNIELVYELLLNTAMDKSVPKEEMIERVLIVSDMEFDCLTSRDEKSVFEYYKQRFAEAGYELPELVFWNVAARNVHTPVTMNEQGVKLVSGASANIFSDVMNGELKAITPYEFMLKVLEPYALFDNILNAA